MSRYPSKFPYTTPGIVLGCLAVIVLMPLLLLVGLYRLLELSFKALKRRHRGQIQ